MPSDTTRSLSLLMETLMHHNIPEHIVEAIDEGACTLFLGAGASQLAGAPSSEEFRRLVCEQFLGETQWPLRLENAASLAVAQTGTRPRLETLIARRLTNLQPSQAHTKVPWFRWRAIVTTNYDRLVEDAYHAEPAAVQQLTPIREEADLAALGSVTAGEIALLKPHGCVTQPHQMSISLEDIYEAKQRRRLLFTQIEALHVMGPVIYIGYSLNDTHILDMLYDLTARLGAYRRPIVFVTRQEKPARAERESLWFQKALMGEYLACGFEDFMNALPERITPVIGPSCIVGQMAPCRAWTFAGNGEASYRASLAIQRNEQGGWECWFNYKINHEEGYAGVVFEKIGEPLDVSRYETVRFELNVPDMPRVDERLEALKLESRERLHVNLLDIAELKGRGWVPVEVALGKYDINRTRLRRVVLADNGHRAALGKEYKVGLRNVSFE